MSIIKLSKNEINRTIPLFKDIPLGWDVMVDSAKDYGFFLADDKYSPNVALAFIGGCIVYAGDANHTDALNLVKELKIQPAVLPYPEEWAKLVKKSYHNAKEQQRYHLRFSSLDRDRLDLNPKKGFKLEKIDLKLAGRLEAEMGEVAQIHHYSSLQDFVHNGCGFCITKNGKLCSIAIAFLRSKHGIQIQITTKEQYRRMDFATITGAAMLKYCIQQGIRADWDAANILSKNLAYKLGYTSCETYPVISIFPN